MRPLQICTPRISRWGGLSTKGTSSDCEVLFPYFGLRLQCNDRICWPYASSSLWLPLFHAVEDWPLALCDGSTVSLQDDLVETDNIRRTYQSANMYMMHRENHKWCFLKKQDVNEVLIFKQFDTERRRKVGSFWRISLDHS